MSKWAGFAVGLIIALTIVLSVVRPFDAQPTRQSPDPAVHDESAPSAAAPVQSIVRPELEELAEVAQVSDVTGPANVAPDATDTHFNVPIPDFRWDQADSGPPSSAVTPLPDPNIQVAQPLPPRAAPAVTDPPSVAARQWYAFWQPFTSELSARGFSARLERVTGLDYRVVKTDTGQYHVAFGYDDDAGREQNLAAIEAATGLNLRGSRL